MSTELRTLSYDLDGLAYGPRPDDFIVSVGKRGLGTVYHIAEARKAKTRDRWYLKVYVANDLKPGTRLQRVSGRWRRRPALRRAPRARLRVSVRGVVAWCIFWYPRTKKK